MSLRKQFLAAAALSAGGVALAHHIAQPLSHADAPEILSRIVLYKQPANLGVPAYLASAVEHDHEVALTDGSSFQVHADGGASETVVFHAADFPDIGHATDAEVVAAVNAALSIARLESQNGYFLFRAVEGGPAHSIRLEDGNGLPLAAMGFADAEKFGSARVQMVISANGGGHDDHGELAHKPYLVFASQTEGSFLFRGVEVPLGRDAVTGAFVQAVRHGQIPSFLAHLNENEDARATVALDELEAVLGPQLPTELHFAYVVFSDDYSSVEFVSNRFTVQIEQ